MPYYRNGDRVMITEHAVRRELAPGSDDFPDNAREMMARLLDALYEAGVLDQHIIANVIGEDWTPDTPAAKERP